MNPRTRWVALWVLLLAPMGAGAQDAAPDIILGFDPSNPLAGVPDLPPVPIETLQPAQVKEANMPPVPDVSNTAADLPLPKGDDSFEFFQPGYQITDDDDGKEEAPPEQPIKIAPKKKDAGRRALPLVRFNYKNQRLPYPIYAKQYDSKNHHLPTAMYETDYDAATFQTVMQNNVNGLRAMLNYGRSPNMKNPHGESLVQTAMRYGAHDCLRLLLARGADPHGATAPNQLAYYALRSAGAR